MLQGSTAAVQHTHAVQFYESEQFLCEALARYVSEGLERGAPTVAIVTKPHRIALERDLSALGVDLEQAISHRQLKLCDAHDMLKLFMVARRPDRMRFVRGVGDLLAGLDGGSGGAHPRAFGEMVDLLWKAGQASAALELEELWNEVTRRRSLSLTCAYAMDNFAVGSESEQFDRVCACHSHVIPTERFAQNAGRETRQREIARLQQRARALDSEVVRRKRSEQALRLRELQLREEHEQLSAALRAKDEFLSMLGHELRNPLAPIMLAADLMRDRTGASSEQEVIERQVMHMTRLVDDLLDIARLSRGKLVLKKRVVLLHDVVVRAVELALPEGNPRRADVQVELPWDLELEIDPERIAQALANLLTNAAKFSDPGTPIAVTAQRSGDGVLLVVRDRGIGIDPEMIERVFELFVQQPQALARAGGLGLGLPIVRDIVRLHDGTVCARSEGPGRGAELRIELPLQAQPTSGGADSARRPPVQLRRILIVDDNEDAARLLARVLQRAGHSVAVAHESDGALELARRFQPEVALLEIGSPKIDGYELGARLRSSDAQLRLVAVSGYDHPASRARSLAAGFEAHVLKPISSDELDALLDQPATERAG